MSGPNTPWDALRVLGARWQPRLLTAICRDTSSPHYGCCDRDWWHYRIRDFPSIILQQGGYALAQAAVLRRNAGIRTGLCELAKAAARFWDRRAQRVRAFEEYYPWEQGYPPLAFSTLAILKLVDEGVVEGAAVARGAAIAARQLRTRFEAQAANQQIAGLAALAHVRKRFPDLVSAESFDRLTKRSLALQHSEGWFEEYGGPDLGYLSVTVDCLWDLFDATGERRFRQALRRAIVCLERLTAVLDEPNMGMHNARNTDYLVPYGLVRAAREGGEEAEAATRVCWRAFARCESDAAFSAAIDDRYVSHYLGQSVLRAVRLLEHTPGAEVANSSGRTAPFRELTASGHLSWWASPDDRRLVTCRKGGVVTWRLGGARMADFGWLVRSGRYLYVSHWWSADWNWTEDPDGLTILGHLYEHREPSSTPLQHFVLRALSISLGPRVIGPLKHRLIFRRPASDIAFRRRLGWSEGRLVATDAFENLPAGAEVTAAPRSSKRHVASADSYHTEDLAPLSGFQVSREMRSRSRGLEVVSVFSRSDESV